MHVFYYRPCQKVISCTDMSRGKNRIDLNPSGMEKSSATPQLHWHTFRIRKGLAFSLSRILNFKSWQVCFCRMVTIYEEI